MKKVIYSNVITGETKTKAEWIEEYDAEKFWIDEGRGDLTAEEYFDLQDNDGFLVEVVS